MLRQLLIGELAVHQLPGEALHSHALGHGGERRAGHAGGQIGDARGAVALGHVGEPEESASHAVGERQR